MVAPFTSPVKAKLPDMKLPREIFRLAEIC